MNPNWRLLKIFGRDWRARLTDQPSHLTVFVTSECNYRCRMCFYWRQIEDKKKQLLTLAEYDRICRNLSISSVALTGGEPFLRKDLAAIAELFIRRSGTRFIFIPTNASLPKTILSETRILLKACPEALITLCLSLDGIGANHDRIRGVPGAFDKFLQTYAGLNLLKKEFANLEVNINFTYSRFNQNQLMPTYQYLADRGAVNFNVAYVRGQTREKTARQADIDRYLKATDEIDRLSFQNQRSSKFGSFWNQFIFARTALVKKLVGQFTKTNQKTLSCLAGRFDLVIDEQGDVYPCEMLPTPLGNLRQTDYKMSRILASSKARWIITKIKNNACGCTHEFNLPDNILYSPKGLWLLFREWRHLHQPVNRKKLLQINIFDENYAAYIRSRRIRKFFAKTGWQVTYSEANYLGKDKSVLNISQTDNALGFLLATLKRCYYVLTLDYDRLFLHQLIPLTVPLMMLARLRGKKVAFDWDDLASGVQVNSNRAWLCRLCETPLIIRLADSLTTHNSWLLKLARQAGVKKAYYLPQGVDTRLFDRKKYLKDRPLLMKKLGLTGKKILVYAALFNTGGGRDFSQVLKMFKQWSSKQKNLVLLVLGDGRLRPRQKIKNVMFLGKVPHPQVPAYLSLASAGLIYMKDNPGNRAKMSFKTLEYLALPIPVLGRLVGETKKAVGRFCNLKHPLDSRAYIIKKFDWSVVERYFREYEDCLC
jgi:MoaA/NifB/PqqE/SkfB family radical SAM enzyme